MTTTLTCNVVSAEKSLFSGEVSLVVATGELGDLGIKPGHAPLITTLKPGPVKLLDEAGKETLFYVSGGFLEVMPSVVNILADTADRAEDLDGYSAENAQTEARRLFLNAPNDIDFSKAKAELAEASARLRVIQQLRDRRA